MTQIGAEFKIHPSRLKVKNWELAVIAIVLTLFSMLGCATVPAKTALEMRSEQEPKLTLGPGDVIEIKFYYVPELNETQTVRPDGKIALQLIGEVEVQGKTPVEVREELVRFYTPQLKRPEVSVIVRSMANRRVYVGGHVNRPGLVDMPTRLTALEAILNAGGFDVRTAEVGNVVIIRHKDGKRYGCALDLRGALEGKEVQPFFLEPQDIVYVPRTKITQVNLWIDQYINRMIPRIGFTFKTPVGESTIGITPPTAVITSP